MAVNAERSLERELPTGSVSVVAALIAPTAWLLHIAVMPALVPLSCEIGNEVALHLTSVVLAAIAFGGVLACHRIGRRLRDQSRGSSERAGIDRARAWSWWGVVLGWLFSVLILLEHVPVFFVEACPP